MRQLQPTVWLIHHPSRAVRHEFGYCFAIVAPSSGNSCCQPVLKSTRGEAEAECAADSKNAGMEIVDWPVRLGWRRDRTSRHEVPRMPTMRALPRSSPATAHTLPDRRQLLQLCQCYALVHLVIVALTGPISTTSVPIGAMKQPSMCRAGARRSRARTGCTDRHHGFAQRRPAA